MLHTSSTPAEYSSSSVIQTSATATQHSSHPVATTSATPAQHAPGPVGTTSATPAQRSSGTVATTSATPAQHASSPVGTMTSPVNPLRIDTTSRRVMELQDKFFSGHQIPTHPNLFVQVADFIEGLPRSESERANKEDQRGFIKLLQRAWSATFEYRMMMTMLSARMPIVLLLTMPSCTFSREVENAV